ncbi:unnamed protein product [Callosobruchus maculatus]|uniref:Odorant receptor n=1 Tax=Callosobruchus maculatus TaxID=64391 RepID=A0A653BVD2_CALMS|nr:unnamed protein product [Callosobruchus maculatus]
MLLMCHVSLAAIVIGILCYYVIFVESMTDKLRHGLHLGGWMSVLYYTCLKGQTTIEESTAIAEITLRIAWYRAPPKVKKYLILMIMRAQKPLVLRTALGTDISLQTYLKIMKSGYSYFTLLICMVK